MEKAVFRDTGAAPTAGPLFAEKRLAALRRHPLFTSTAERVSRAELEVYAGFDATARWMFKDLGRAAMYLALVVLDRMPGGATAGVLARACVAGGAGSRARVLAFVDRGLASRCFTLAPGSQPWTKRRLILAAAFRNILRRSMSATMNAVSEMAPDVADAVPLLADDDRFAAAAAALAVLARDGAALGMPPMPAVAFFIHRDGGLRMLQDLVGRQKPDRSRLLTAAQLPMTEVAERCGFSRIHLETLLEDAAAAGLLSRPTRDVVIFSAPLNADFERYIAVQIEGLRFVARAMKHDAGPFALSKP
jgi:hypothetical protein